MNCTFHSQNQVSMICIAPHLCQCLRKLCAECQVEHGVDTNYIVSIKNCQEMILKKQQEHELCELNGYRINFKSMLSQTETFLKKIWEELSESVNLIYDMIEQENKSFINLINENTNLIELAQAELENLVQILQGKTLDNCIIQENKNLIKVEKMKNWWDQEVKAFSENLIKEMKEIVSVLKIKHIEQGNQAQIQKTDIYEIFASIKHIDEFLFKILTEMLNNEKISDVLGFLQANFNEKLYEQYFCQEENLSPFEKIQKFHEVKNKIELIAKVIKNLFELDFNKKNYSSWDYFETRKNLIAKIQNDRKIIQFLQFLVRLTALDDRLIQCGSNSLNLLVEMKSDLNGQCFENINIKDTSLIGGNFTKCNLSGSTFENVNINGININGAQLINCKWKKIKIDEMTKLIGHKERIQSLCFSHDGSMLASGSQDKSIRFWDLKTGQQKAKLDGHARDVITVCFSPDDTTIASGSEDNSIRLWDVKTGQQKQKLNGHSAAVNSVCFSPSGYTLASGSTDRSIRLWNVKTGQFKTKLDGHSDKINSMCFSPDGAILVSGGVDKLILLWDVKTSVQKAKLDGHSKSVNSVCISPDGATLISCSEDKLILLWDVKKALQKGKIDFQYYSVNSVCLSPDGSTLASSSSFLSLWDVATEKQIVKFNSDYSESKCICFSPDGNILAEASRDHKIRLWDIKTIQQKVRRDFHSDKVQSVCFSPDGTTIVSGSQDRSIRLWDVKTGQQKAQIDGNKIQVESICFSPDGAIFAASHDKSIRLWDLKTGQKKSTLNGHYRQVNSVCFSPDSTTLASGSSDKSIRLWDTKTGGQKANLDFHSDLVNSVCFSPDGATLASGSTDGSIILCDVKTRQQKLKLNRINSFFQSVCFSPDGSTLASGSGVNFDDISMLSKKYDKSFQNYSNSIFLWDVQTGEQNAQLDGHADCVYSICFSPDGTILASGSADKSIRLWDVKKGQEKQKLDGHTSVVRSVCFSPCGAKLASGSHDKSIRIWEVKLGRQIIPQDGHISQVQQISSSSHHTELVSNNAEHQQSNLSDLLSGFYSICNQSDPNFLNNSICVWDVRTGQQLQPQDNILAQFKPLFQQNRILQDGTITIHHIFENLIFQAKGALILKGEYFNEFDQDVRYVFKEAGGCLLESQEEQHLIKFRSEYYLMDYQKK